MMNPVEGSVRLDRSDKNGAYGAMAVDSVLFALHVRITES